MSTSTLTPGVPRIRLFLGLKSQSTPVLLFLSLLQRQQHGEPIPANRDGAQGSAHSPALGYRGHCHVFPSAGSGGPSSASTPPCSLNSHKLSMWDPSMLPSAECSRFLVFPFIPTVQHLLSTPASLNPHTHTSGTNAEPGPHLNHHQHLWLGQSCAVNPQEGLGRDTMAMMGFFRLPPNSGILAQFAASGSNTAAGPTAHWEQLSLQPAPDSTPALSPCASLWEGTTLCAHPWVWGSGLSPPPEEQSHSHLNQVHSLGKTGAVME